MNNSNIHELTREIYQKQHTRIISDKKAMKRYINMFSTDYFGFKKNFFKKKRVLDAGCGSTGKLIIAFSKMGCTDIHGIEIGTDFIATTLESLRNYNVPLTNVKLQSGNLLNLPYENNHFDFVACHGVLQHLQNLQEVQKAFSELTRVVRGGGYLYTSVGLVGGLFDDAIIPSVRNYYKTNKQFKYFIDNISENDFSKTIDFITSSIFKHTKEKINGDIIKPLFDNDLCVTIQNAIQAPVRLQIPQDFLTKLYRTSHFKNIRKLKRYIKRENIRKFFAPLHFKDDYPISKILYGSGYLEMIGKK